jgi:hypothetical protein
MTNNQPFVVDTSTNAIKMNVISLLVEPVQQRTPQPTVSQLEDPEVRSCHRQPS